MPEVSIAETPPPSKTEERWSHVLELSCRLTVEIPLPGFKIRDLMALAVRGIVDTHWRAGLDVPLRVNGELIGWCEFELVGNRLGVRITDLA